MEVTKHGKSTKMDYQSKNKPPKIEEFYSTLERDASHSECHGELKLQVMSDLKNAFSAEVEFREQSVREIKLF